MNIAFPQWISAILVVLMLGGCGQLRTTDEPPVETGPSEHYFGSAQLGRPEFSLKKEAIALREARLRAASAARRENKTSLETESPDWKTDKNNRIYRKWITESFVGKCVRVIDGDTIEVFCAEQDMVQVQFESIIAPEPGYPYCDAATKFIEDQLIGKFVKVEVTDEDEHGSKLGWVITIPQPGELGSDIPMGDVPGTNLNAELLRRGLARYDNQFSNSRRLAEIETRTKEAGRGLWADRPGARN